ncbi:MAG TPA: prepilin peptidase, partial [Acidimicrobiales bacterium]|nr:prepilin peptidase [Acidimicrobiales bacterium]
PWSVDLVLRIGNDGAVTLVRALLVALMGLCVGSFLNVVIDRVPKFESVISPRSRCPQCKTPIKTRDNVPLLSWFALRGRCRSCDAPISVQYPLVELGTSMLFAVTEVHFGLSGNFVIFIILFMGIIPLAIIDLRCHRLPLRVFYPVLAADFTALVSYAAIRGAWSQLLVALATGVTWFLMFFVINLVRPDALGFGDVRLVGLLGICLGWLGVTVAFVGFFASNLIGLAVGIFLIATNRAKRDTPIPYGLFLAVGTVFAVFAGPSIADHLRSLR